MLLSHRGHYKSYPLLVATYKEPLFVHQTPHKSYIKNYTYRLYIPPFFNSEYPGGLNVAMAYDPGI
jgi:hypothetical protein